MSVERGTTADIGLTARARASWYSFHREYTAGITISVSRVLEIIPPTIGAAIRFIVLAPVSVPQRIGSNPAMIAVTVIIFGRTRSTAPSTIAA